MANRFLRRDEQQSLEEPMTSTEFNRNEIEAPAEPGSIGAGAEIYRRMERRGKQRPMWMTAAPIVAVAVIAAGAVVAYEATKSNTAPKPPVQAAQSAPPAATPAQVAATTPKPAPVVAPTPAAPVRVVHEVKIEHVRPAVMPVAHKRTIRRANAAAAASEDTSATTPAPRPIVRPTPAPAASSPAAPAQSTAPAPTVTAPPVAVTPAPAPVTASPPPASTAPSDSSQTAPAPQ
jgi:hypothetical protein